VLRRRRVPVVRRPSRRCPAVRASGAAAAPLGPLIGLKSHCGCRRDIGLCDRDLLSNVGPQEQ
jgi:hypothetical protein